MTTLPTATFTNGYHEDLGLNDSPVFKSAGDGTKDSPHQLAEGGVKHCFHPLLGKNGVVRGQDDLVAKRSLENHAGAARHCFLGTFEVYAYFNRLQPPALRVRFWHNGKRGTLDLGVAA